MVSTVLRYGEWGGGREGSVEAPCRHQGREGNRNPSRRNFSRLHCIKKCYMLQVNYNYLNKLILCKIKIPDVLFLLEGQATGQISETETISVQNFEP